MGGPINVGQFEVSQQIGEGAFSKVYLGASKDPQAHPLHRQVAIKIIGVPSSGNRVEYVKKLTKEVRLHKAVTHLNVLRLLQWSEGATAESMWIVLEYCHGGDLFDKITPDRGIPEDLAHVYFTQLLAALQYCHNSGIAHRDIKPENMLLDLEGNLKLADFGLAELFRYQGREKKLVEACGSAPYAAPELALGTPYRAEPIDLWSAGVVLFTLLVGNTPWDQPTEASEEYAAYITGELLQEDPWTRLPEGLLSLLQHILHPQPKERAKMKDIREHPWFNLDNPYLNKKGLVSDKDVLWGALIGALADGGEFDTEPTSQTSAWSDDSDILTTDQEMQTGSQQTSQLGPRETQGGSQRSQAHENIPFTQPPASQTVPLPQIPFKETGKRGRKQQASRVDLRRDTIQSQFQSQQAQRHSQIPSQPMQSMAQAMQPLIDTDRRDHANARVAELAANRKSTMQASAVMMTGMAGTAAHFSPVFALAPSQVADPNLARWFSLCSIDAIWEAIKAALDALGVTWIREFDSRGAAARIQVKDGTDQWITGSVHIQYEPTEDDYATIAPDADFSDLHKQREAALAQLNKEEDVTMRGGMIAPPKGVGRGGYVVKIQSQGNPVERKRLFKEIQNRMPRGLVYAR